MYCPYCATKNFDYSKFCKWCGEKISQNESHQLPVGTILSGRYYVGAVIRQGGFGITYEGADRRLEKKVAIKEYYPNGFANRLSEHSKNLTISVGDKTSIFENGKKRFKNEALLLAEFSDEKNIVNVTDIFEENNTIYMVMEYVGGDDLDQKLDKEGIMSFDKAFSLLRPIIETVGRMHKRGLIHRDISPANIKVLPNGVTKLLDLGAAREYDTSDSQSFTIILKPGYAPPEQYQQHSKQGPWTDVYAICATLYKMITGVTPENSLERLQNDIVASPSMQGANISAHQEKVLLRGMNTRYTWRIQSMDELLSKLLCPPMSNKKKVAMLVCGLFFAFTVTVAITTLVQINQDKPMPDQTVIDPIPDPPAADSPSPDPPALDPPSPDYQASDSSETATEPDLSDLDTSQIVSIDGYESVNLSKYQHSTNEKKEGMDWDDELYNKINGSYLEKCTISEYCFIDESDGRYISCYVYRNSFSRTIYKIVSVKDDDTGLFEINDYYYKVDKPYFVFCHNETEYNPSLSATLDKPGKRFYFNDDVLVRSRVVDESGKISQTSLMVQGKSQFEEFDYFKAPEAIKKQYVAYEKEWLNKAYNMLDAVQQSKTIGEISGRAIAQNGNVLSYYDVFVQNADTNAVIYESKTDLGGKFDIFVYRDNKKYRILISDGVQIVTSRDSLKLGPEIVYYDLGDLN